jgi:hypothetical protein
MSPGCALSIAAWIEVKSATGPVLLFTVSITGFNSLRGK